MKVQKSTSCRYCHSKRLTCFLSLGLHPPSNSFLAPKQIPEEKRYPLEVYFCEECFLVQLLDVVPGEEIFKDYKYLSSSSRALKNHYGELARNLSERFQLCAGDVVVDIGCNDGILLQGYASSEIIRVGVEPSQIAEMAKGQGLEIFHEFFAPQTAQDILRKYRPPKLVTMTNVFAHVDRMGEFAQALSLLLDGGSGVFVIEAPYLLDMVDQALFDTIYHEHLCYLSLTPVIPFLERYQLEIFDVQRVPFGASGPAFRLFGRKRSPGKSVAPSVGRMLREEDRWGIGKVATYRRFAHRVEQVRKKLLGMIRELKEEESRLGGYGAPAKGNTLLNYLNLGPDVVECIAETNPLKQGLVTPGSHIPIVSEEDFLGRGFSYALLLSWNYLDFFLTHSAYTRGGGRFLVPLPEPRLSP